MENKTDSLQWLYKEHLETIGGVKFTHREIDVIALILSGRSPKVIANLLEIAPKTVETHIHNIKLKMECNSREGVINFIEKTNKLSFVQKYQSSLLGNISFEHSLKKIPSLLDKKNITCFINYLQEKEGSPSFILQLEKYLKLSGIKTELKIRKTLEFFDDIVKDQGLLESHHIVYVGSKNLISQLQEEIKEKIPKNVKSQKMFFQNSTIVILLYEEHNSSSDSSSASYVQAENQNSQHTFVINFLKKLLPSLKVEEIFLDFKKQDELSESVSSKDLLSLQKDKPSVESHESCFSGLEVFSRPAKYFLMGSLVFMMLFCVWVLVFQENISYMKESSIRSELPIPNDAVLLKRSILMQQISGILEGKNPIEIVAIVGIGGAGKTTLARQYAKTQNLPVVWEINAETNDSRIDSFKKLANALAKSESQKNELGLIQKIGNLYEQENQLMLFIKKELKEKQNWLLIYDNVEMFADIKNYFPLDSTAWGMGKVIITTKDENIKNSHYINSDNVIHMGELPQKDIVHLFTSISYHLSPEQLSPYQRQEVLKFLENIPPFPLDVSVSAYYIKNSHVSYEEYLERISKFTNDFQHLQEDLLKEIGSYTKTRYGIITSSIAQLIQINSDFKELLFLICLLDSQNIPKNFLELLKDNLLADNFIHHLHKHSLIFRGASSKNSQSLSTLSLHRSTQAIGLSFLKNILSSEEQKEFIRKNIELIKLVHQNNLDQKCKNANLIIPHIESLLKHLKEAKINNATKEKYEKQLLFILGYEHHRCTRNSILTKKYFSELAKAPVDFQAIPEEDFANMLKDLGASCVHLGLLEESIDHAKRSIKIASSLKNSDLLISKNLRTIGHVFEKENNFNEAKRYYEMGLKKISSVDSLQKKEVESTIYERLARLYMKTYLNKEISHLSEQYALMSLAVLNANYLFQKNINPSRLSCQVARSKTTLGEVYCHLGQYDKALEEGFQEAQYILNHQLDACPHNLLKGTMSLGVGEVYLRKNKLEDAEKRLTESIKIYQELAGEHWVLHPKIFRAEARIRLGKLPEAYEDCLSVLSIKNRTQVDNYSNLAYLTCFYHAAIIQYKQRNFSQSAEYFAIFFAQAKIFCKEFLGAKQYQDLESMKLFSDIPLNKTSTIHDVRSYLERSEAIFLAIYGPKHPFVIDYVMQN